MKEKKKVLMLLTNPFNPDPRVYKEAKSLVKAGYEITILCWDRQLKHKKKEKIDGINVERIRLRAGYGFKSMIFKLPIFWIKLFFKALKKDFDIVHSHDFDTLLVGVLLKIFKKKKLIYDSHELFLSYTENNLINSLIFSYEKILLPKIDLLIYTNEKRLTLFLNKLPRKTKQKLSNKKIIIHNYPPLQKEHKKSWNMPLRFQLSGSARKDKQIFNIIKALEKVNKKNILTELILIGNYQTEYGKEIINYINRNKIKGVTIKKSKKFNEFLNFLWQTHVVLIPISQTHLNNIFPEPNKLFEAFATKNFVITENNKYLRRIINNNGIYCDFSNIKDIIKKIKWVLKHKSEIIKKTEYMYKEHINKYNWVKEGEKLINAYKGLIGRSK